MDESTLNKINELKVSLWFGIIILIIGILSSVDRANPDIIDNIDDVPKQCLYNQKLITNAIKGYNSNTLFRINEALPGKDFEELEEKLSKNWYLNNPIKLPDPECSYGYIIEDNKEIVFCKHHGSADSIIPSYDKNKERPFSDKHIKYIIELKNAKKQKESIIANIRGLVDPTIFIIFGLIVIVLNLEQIHKLKNINIKPYPNVVIVFK